MAKRERKAAKQTRKASPDFKKAAAHDVEIPETKQAPKAPVAKGIQLSLITAFLAP